MAHFAERSVCSWDCLGALFDELTPDWVFRGQSNDWELDSSLDRACQALDVDGVKRRDAEDRLIREFRRRYKGSDRSLVLKDTLHCMSVMQHYGAPTRLLDFTYSPYVAAFFALEEQGPNAVVWAMREGWCRSEAERVVGKKLVHRRNVTRDESSFLNMYKKGRSFAFLDNPLPLNRRLIIQQGVFLCQGDVRIGACDNVRAMRGWEDNKNVLKISLSFTRDEWKRTVKRLIRMNMDRASLFPGLDGFARSLKFRLPVLLEQPR